tara:strand:- start:603 stop:770 length:168 start_codon:yes stop_codon:yes gene_type:complete
MKYNGIENDLEYIIDMYWQVEKEHWEELDNPSDHIFNNLNNVKNFLIGRNNGKLK